MNAPVLFRIPLTLLVAASARATAADAGDLVASWRLAQVEHPELQSVFYMGTSALLILLLTLLLYILRLRSAERRQQGANAELLAQRNRFRSLLEAMPDPVWVKDLDGRIRFCNQAFADKLFDGDPAALIGKNDADLLDDADLVARIQTQDRQVADRNEALFIEQVLRHQDGQPVVYQTWKAPLRDADGGVTAILSIAQDISELRRNQFQLVERIKEQDCLYDVFRLTELNDTPLPDLLQQVAARLPLAWQFPQSCRAEIIWQQQSFDAGAHGPANASLERPLYVDGREQGQLRISYVDAPITAGQAAFFDEEIRLLEAVAARLGTIIEQRQRDTQARQQQEQYQAVVEQAVEAVTLVDVASLDIIDVNHSACEQLGYTRPELLQLRLPDIQGELDEPAIRGVIESFLSGGSHAMETRRRRKDGSLLDVRVSIKVLQLHERKLLSIVWSDITEERRSRQLLARNEARFRILFERSMQPVMLIKDGLFVDANQAALTLLGATAREQLVGHSPDQLSPPLQPDGQDSRTKAARYIAQAFSQGALRFEWEHVKLNGEHFLAEVMLTAIDIGDEQYLHVVWNDITERIKAERTLRESEERYRMLAENGSDVIWLYDLQEDRFSYVSPSVKRLIAFDPVDLAQRSSKRLSLLQPASNAEAIAFRERLAAFEAGDLESRSETHETRIRHRDGHEIDVEMATTLLPDGNGKVVRVVGVLRDISSRKAAERILRQRETEYRLAVETSQDGFWAVDAQGRVVQVNDAYCRMSGYSREELVGMPIAVIDMQHDPTQVAQHIEKLLQQGHDVFETEHRRKDGSIWPVEVAVNHAEETNLFYSFLRDLTERKEAMQKLRQYQLHLEELVATRTQQLEHARNQAEAANLAKSTFLANMSHEIRTPMNAVIGFAHLLQQELHEPRQLDKVQKIAGSAKHLLGIINDILDLSKIEADRVELESTPFNMSSLVDHACSNVRERIAAKNLHLEESVDPRLVTLTLEGDQLRLSQILINYLSNATKFTERGSIQVRARLLQDRGTHVDVRLEVEDTGIGLSAEQVQRLFLPFEQGESSTTRKYGGTGLGLVISRRLAELMGGTTGVTSAPGEGSTFWVQVSLRKSEVSLIPEPEQLAGQTRPRRGAKVLLAEDNAVNQEVARDLLQAVGLQVVIAGNGKEALQRVKSERFDLVLMDMQMPVMDGLEATRLIKQLPEAADLPILAMTANAFEEDRQRCEAAGMVDFLPKPVDPERLYTTLAHWLPADAVAHGRSVPAPQVAATPATPAIPVIPAATLPAVLDETAALQLLGGDQTKYALLLRNLLDNHAGDPERLRSAFTKGDTDQARHLAHSIKGAAATLGALRVAARAEAIEKYLRSSPGKNGGLAEDIQALEKEFRQLRAAIDARTTPQEQTSPGIALEPAALARLQFLLEHDELEAGVLWQSLRVQLAARLPAATLRTLQQHMDRFELREAAALLRRELEVDS